MRNITERNKRASLQPKKHLLSCGSMNFKYLDHQRFLELYKDQENFNREIQVFQQPQYVTISNIDDRTSNDVEVSTFYELAESAIFLGMYEVAKNDDIIRQLPNFSEMEFPTAYIKNGKLLVREAVNSKFIPILLGALWVKFNSSRPLYAMAPCAKFQKGSKMATSYSHAAINLIAGSDEIQMIETHVTEEFVRHRRLIITI